MPYDPDSGLVFSETVVQLPRKKKNELRRLTKCIGRSPEYVSPEHGPPTLVELSMLKILRSLKLLDEDSLSTVPPTLLEKIWKAITRSQLDSLRIWKIFAQSSIGQTSLLQVRRPLSLPSIEMATVCSPSPHCSWITSLEITTREISLEELILVSKLDNLRSFLMATTRRTSADMGVNDRVLRSWAESVQQRGALQHLRFIFLYCQLRVTKWCLPHLDAFPKLDEFCAYDCGIQWRDVEHRQGWRQKPEASFFAFVQASEAHKQQMENYTSYVKPISWSHLVADYIRTELKSSNEDIDCRPLLRIRVGVEPTAISHRLDDPSAIVCLKRGTEPRAIKKEVLVERRDTRPQVKRRKIVFDSGDLGGMLGG